MKNKRDSMFIGSKRKFSFVDQVHYPIDKAALLVNYNPILTEVMTEVLNIAFNHFGSFSERVTAMEQCIDIQKEK